MRCVAALAASAPHRPSVAAAPGAAEDGEDAGDAKIVQHEGKSDPVGNEANDEPFRGPPLTRSAKHKAKEPRQCRDDREVPIHSRMKF